MIKYVFDEVHGYISLRGVSLKIVDTPTFQRLRRIKQLAQAWFVYPGAVHTRFSHSLGVMHLMNRVVDKFIKEGRIRRDDKDLLITAALLHDIGHTPYSHAIEAFFNMKYRLKHEEISSWIITEDPHIRDILSYYGIEPHEVAAIVLGRHREESFNMLMSSDMDVDRLDYLPRDALHSGVKYGVIDLERIVQTITLDSDNRIAIPQKAVQAAESFYIARIHMYRSLYYHKTIAGYQMLVQEIYKLMTQEKEVKEYLQPFDSPEGIRNAIRAGKIFLWDDFYIGGLMNFVIGRRLGSEVLRELIRLYLERSGYRTIYEWMGFGNRYPLPAKIISSLEKLSKESLSRTGNDHTIKTFAETVPIITEGAEVRIICPGGSIPITQYQGSLIRKLPEAMGLVRVYSLPVAEKMAKELVSKFLSHNISI